MEIKGVRSQAFLHVTHRDDESFRCLYYGLGNADSRNRTTDHMHDCHICTARYQLARTLMDLYHPAQFNKWSFEVGMSVERFKKLLKITIHRQEVEMVISFLLDHHKDSKRVAGAKCSTIWLEKGWILSPTLIEKLEEIANGHSGIVAIEALAALTMKAKKVSRPP